MEKILEENSNFISLLFSFIFYNNTYYLFNRLNNMKDWHFWVLVAIILIQSFYLSMKIGSIEKQETELQEYARNIDQNVATVDERLVWDIIPKVETLYDKSY
jgi:hypothetical protein